MEVVLEAGEMAATWVAEEKDLVAGMDILAGARLDEGKTTRDISGGTLHSRSIRAGMTLGEGETGPGDDGAEASSPKLIVAFQRFIFHS